jgi:hypothetical protein
MQLRMTQLLQIYDNSMSSSHTARVTNEPELGESDSPAANDPEMRTRMKELRCEAKKQVWPVICICNHHDRFFGLRSSMSML